MIVMAADYVGYHIVKYLCERREDIRVLVVDSCDRGSYNNEIIKLVEEANPQAEIVSEKELKDPAVLENIREKQYEFGILAWWPYIVNSEIISVTKRGFINTHPAFLPYNRGKHPYFWSIVEGTPFGVTLHFVDTGIDSGAIIARREIPVTWEDTGETLYNRAREEMLALFYQYFDRIKLNDIKATPQDDTICTNHFGKELEPYCSICLDETYTARELFNICRGRMFYGKGGANFMDNGKRYSVSITITEEK